MLNASYDFDNFIEDSQPIQVSGVVKALWNNLIKDLKQNGATINGNKVKLTATKTQFSGIRYWFSCPKCNKRVGTLYNHPKYNYIGCKECLGLKYISKHKRLLNEYEKNKIRLHKKHKN